MGPMELTINMVKCPLLQKYTDLRLNVLNLNSDIFIKNHCDGLGEHVNMEDNGIILGMLL